MGCVIHKASPGGIRGGHQLPREPASSSSPSPPSSTASCLQLLLLFLPLNYGHLSNTPVAQGTVERGAAESKRCNSLQQLLELRLYSIQPVTDALRQGRQEGGRGLEGVKCVIDPPLCTAVPLNFCRPLSKCHIRSVTFLLSFRSASSPI